MKDGDLRKLERQHLKGFHLVSVETGLTGMGVPDMNYCYGGIEGWIENKWCKGWQVHMRPEQIGWILRRKRAGGNVYVAVRRINKTSLSDEFYLFDGADVEALNNVGLRCGKALIKCSGGPARWDWPAVAALLAPGIP